MTSFMMASCLISTGTRCSSLQPRPQHSFRFELCTSDRLRLWTLWLKIQSRVLEVYLLLLFVLHLPRKFANQECLPWQIELLWVVIPLLIKITLAFSVLWLVSRTAFAHQGRSVWWRVACSDLICCHPRTQHLSPLKPASLYSSSWSPLANFMILMRQWHN